MKSRSGQAVTPPADGFTIVEVLVAVTVLVIAMMGAALLFENAIIASGNTRNRIVAANLATAQVESVRGQAADPTRFAAIYDVSGAQTVTNPVVNGITYTVKQDLTFVTQNSTVGTCDAPTGIPTSGQILQVVETVSWPDMGGTQPVKTVTSLAAPVGAYVAGYGAIATKVVNAAGAPSQNINVQIAGPTSDSLQTTSEGCAYFYQIPPGTYTVTVIEGTGVGDQEVVAPAQTTSVVAGQSTSIQFQYDFAATITATLPSPTNTAGAPPHASNLSISVGNTGLQPYRQFSFPAAATGDVTTSPGLFPYTSGYNVYAGNCTDNNPLGRNSTGAQFYPTAAPIPTTVTPSGSAVATVPLYPLAVHVNNAAGVATVGAISTALETSGFATPNATVCTSGTATATPPTLGLVATNATGDSLTAVPLGHFTIKAVLGTKSGTVNVWVKPDGVYAVNATGVTGAKYTGAIPVVTN